jgi:hypothetical protein
MSMLEQGDASEFEGAFKRKEFTSVPSRHKKDSQVEEKEPGSVFNTLISPCFVFIFYF